MTVVLHTNHEQLLKVIEQIYYVLYEYMNSFCFQIHRYLSTQRTQVQIFTFEILEVLS